MDWTGVRVLRQRGRRPATAGVKRHKKKERISGGKFMSVSLDTAKSTGLGITKKIAMATASLLLAGGLLPAQEAGGEANLKLPDLSQVSFLGVNGHQLLLYGIGICVLGLLFGLMIFTRL